MKDRSLRTSFHAGMLAALLVAAGMLLSSQGCLPPPRARVIVSAPSPVLPAPPFLYLIPGTYAYFVAGVDVDIFFYQGFWYRPHLGRWYRAHEYNGPWDVIVTNRVPLVLQDIPQTYRRVPPGSGRLHHDDVRNNWRTWERERHWDRQDERKREQIEERDRSGGEDRGRGRNDYRDNSRDRGPEHRPMQQYQEPRQREERPFEDRTEYRDRDKDKDRGRNRKEFRDNSGDPGPPQREDPRGLNRHEDRNRGQGREQDMRQGQERPSAPVRQLTPPKVQQQEKKEPPPKAQQDRMKGKKKDKSSEQVEEKDGAASQDKDESGRDEREQGKRKNR